MAAARALHLRAISNDHGRAKRLADPDKLLKQGRDADGAMRIKNQEAEGGPGDGVYGIDDKAGESFDLKQARDISTLADSPQGLNMGGQELDGYVYWCENSSHADTLLYKLDAANLSSKLHVAFIDSSGAVRWRR